MKKLFVLGMAVATLASTQSFAGALPKGYVDYVAKVKTNFVDAKGVKEGTKDVLASKLNIAGDNLANLDMALKSGKKTDKLMALAAAKEIALKNNDEVTSKAADATASLVLRSAMMSKIEGKSSEDPMVIANQAILKIESKAEEMLTTFGPQERAGYRDVLVKFDEIVSTDRFGSYEEKFLKAIEQSRGVSREKAIEIAKKLRDCV